MKLIRTEVPGLLKGLAIVELDIYPDNRGFFLERFNEKKFEDLGLPVRFFQDNHSHSLSRVLRGLHFQVSPPQSKLVGVTRGRILDVVVDVRPDSLTFKKHFKIELSAEQARLLWVPAGFAHGFCVLGNEPADVFYKVDCPFSVKGDRGIRWDDPELKIEWPSSEPILSEKDRSLPLISQLSFSESPSLNGGISIP